MKKSIEEFVHNSFETNRWKPSKKLRKIDEYDNFMEDVAQYIRGDFCVDLGYYGKTTHICIYLIHKSDWENYLMKVEFKNIEIAIKLMIFLSETSDEDLASYLPDNL